MPLYNPPTDLLSLMSSSVPLSETPSGSAGSTGKLPDAGHQHPRLTSADVATIVTGSTVKVMFTRQFTKVPSFIPTLIEQDTAGQQPVLFAVTDWIAPDGTTSLGRTPTDGTAIGGCVVKAWRANSVPQNLATLLLSTAFNIFAATVVGVSFSYVAVASSRP